MAINHQSFSMFLTNRSINSSMHDGATGGAPNHPSITPSRKTNGPEQGGHRGLCPDWGARHHVIMRAENRLRTRPEKPGLVTMKGKDARAHVIINTGSLNSQVSVWEPALRKVNSTSSKLAANLCSEMQISHLGTSRRSAWATCFALPDA